MKKLIVILLSCIISITALVGCGDEKEEAKASQKQETISKDKESKDKLNESDKKLLKKSYYDFDSSERTQFADIEEKINRMTVNEKNEYLKDFKRLEREREIQIKKWKKEDREKEIEEEKEADSKDSEVVKSLVKTYFSGWKEKDYSKMYDVAQESWKSRNKEDLLESWYDFKDLKSFEILKVEGSDIAKNVIVQCEYDMGSLGTKKCTIVVNVINENGDWGINPTSALKEE